MPASPRHGALAEGAVPVVEEKAGLPRRGGRGDEHIEVVVVVEVIHDGTAGVVVCVHRQFGSDVLKPGNSTSD